MTEEDKIENPDEEVARETTLQDMVEQLTESNLLQKSLQEQSLKTTDVLANIATILQSQLDLSEREKLDEGRQLPNSDEEDDKPSKNPFEKLVMPTSVAEGIGVGAAFFAGSIRGFLTEMKVWFKIKGKEVNKLSSKTLTKLQATYRFVKGGIVQLSTAIGNLVTKAFKIIFQPLVDLRASFSSGGKIDKMLKGLKAFFGIWQPFFAAITRVATRIIAFIVAPIIGIMTAIEDFNAQDTLGAGIVAGALGFITGVVKFMITELADIVKSFVSWMIEKIFGDGNPFSKFLDSFTFSELFVEGMHLIRDWILSIPEYFMDALSRGRESGLGMAGLTSVLLSDLGGFVANLFGFLSEMFHQGLMKIPGMLATFQFAEDFGNAVVKSLKDAWKALKGYFTDGVNFVMEKLGNGIDFVMEKIGNIFDTVKDFKIVVNFKDLIKNGINFIGELLTNAVNSVISSIKETEWGAKLFEVFSDMWGKVVKIFKEKFEFLPNSIKKLFGIEETTAIPMSTSPSSGASSPGFWSGLFGDDEKTELPPEDRPATSLTKTELEKMDNEELDSVISGFDPVAAERANEVMNERIPDSVKRDVRDADQLPQNNFGSQDFVSTGSVMGTGGFANPEDAAEIKAVGDAAREENQRAFQRRQAEKNISNIPEKTGGGIMGALGRIFNSEDNQEKSIPIAVGATPAAVNQGRALESGTNQLAEGKSKQQTKAPLVISNPNNSQQTTNNVSNSTVDNGSPSAANAYDPYSSHAPWSASR